MLGYEGNTEDEMVGAEGAIVKENDGSLVGLSVLS